MELTYSDIDDLTISVSLDGYVQIESVIDALKIELNNTRLLKTIDPHYINQVCCTAVEAKLQHLIVFLTDQNLERTGASHADN